MKMFKKVVLTASLLLGVSNSVYAGNLIIDGTQRKVVETPHFYEFDSSENPYNYWWCGQTAFKTALESQGIYKTLYEIHNDFKNVNSQYSLGVYSQNNCGNNGSWCASPVLMDKAIQSYKNDGYDISYKRKTVYSASSLLSTVKSEISKGNTIVALSRKYYNYNTNSWTNIGHFVTINGYYDGNSQIIYVRDPIKQNSGGWIADKGFKLDEFYNNTNIHNSIVLGIISNN